MTRIEYRASLIILVSFLAMIPFAFLIPQPPF